MLRGIHKASSTWLGRIIMGVVLGAIAVIFGLWGIGDIFRGYGSNSLATVGGTEIRLDTFRQLYQERITQLSRQVNRPILPDQARALGLDRQLLNQSIADAALDERTRALKLGISDAELARQVADMPGFKGINGQFERARFDAVLRNAGYTEQRFLAEQRRIALRQQLMDTVSGDAPVPKAALDAFNRFQNEERTIEYVVLGPAQAGDIADPSPEVLNKYFQERSVVFRAPEYRAITVVVAKPEDIAATIQVSDADLQKVYQDRKARYETPERRHLKQIVFPNLDEAKAASEKIAQGTSFEALAAERNLKDSDIDLGTVAKSALVDREVADAAFGLKAGEVSKPIEGRFGIAIVKVDSIEAGGVKPLADVAADLKREISLERARSQMIDMQEKIEDERLGGASLADAAKKFGLTPRVIPAVDRNGKDPQGNTVADLPKEVDVLSPAFAADVHADNDAIKLPNNAGYVWYDVDKITPARDRPLDEVKDQVLARWRDDEIAKRLTAKATELLDKIKAGTSFNDAVAADNLKIEWRPGIKRNATVPGLSPVAVTDVFKTAKDQAAASDGTSPTQRIVFRVTEIKVPPLDVNADDIKRLQDALKSAAADDLNTQYITRLRSDVGVTINESALAQVTGTPQY